MRGDVGPLKAQLTHSEGHAENSVDENSAGANSENGVESPVRVSRGGLLPAHRGLGC